PWPERCWLCWLPGVWPLFGGPFPGCFYAWSPFCTALIGGKIRASASLVFCFYWYWPGGMTPPISVCWKKQAGYCYLPGYWGCRSEERRCRERAWGGGVGRRAEVETE